MNLTTFNTHHHNVSRWAQELMERKAVDYGSAHNVFEEFEATGDALGMPPEHVLAVHLSKQVRALLLQLSSATRCETVEDIASRVMDTINYAVLAYAMALNREDRNE